MHLRAGRFRADADCPHVSARADRAARRSGPVFEYAHKLRDGKSWESFGTVEDEPDPYDLIIVGAGISGLAAAIFIASKKGSSARILILDNHDDFGGHARRNEFEVERKIAAGKRWHAIDRKSGRIQQGRQGVLKDLGIDVQKFYKALRRETLCGSGDRLLFRQGNVWRGQAGDRNGRDAVGGIPGEDAAFTSRYRRTSRGYTPRKRTILPARSKAQKIALLKSISYAELPDEILRRAAGIVAVFSEIFA